MKTLTAILAHAGIGAIQSVVASGTIPPDKTWSPFVGIGMQIGLTALHGIVARVNSKTDPKGNPLAQLDEQKFVSAPKQ